MIGTHAASMLRNVHWWLMAFVLFLGIASYFEPVTFGYMCYSLMVGVAWCVLTLMTWCRRSSVLSAVTIIMVFESHYIVRALQAPPLRPLISGVLVSGVTQLCILWLARSQVRRFCGLLQ